MSRRVLYPSLDHFFDAPESPAPPLGPCVGGLTLVDGFIIIGFAPNIPVEPFGCAPRSSLRSFSLIGCQSAEAPESPAPPDGPLDGGFMPEPGLLPAFGFAPSSIHRGELPCEMWSDCPLSSDMLLLVFVAPHGVVSDPLNVALVCNRNPHSQ